MLPGDRLFCSFVEPRPVGDTFAAWPLHITVVPWFRTELPNSELCGRLSQRLQTISAFTVRVAGEDMFGGGRRLVSLIAEPTPLHDIEREARDLLHQAGAWLVDETTKLRRPYRPHVTAQVAGRLHESDSFDCDALYIVQQKGDHKEVVEKLPL
jgi:2'-5' RNA ligase